jgi:hypothetical protein
MHPRGPYIWLAVVFSISRIGYYLAGVRFDTRPIFQFFQFIDPELLKHRLLESLYYLHVQPPGLDLYAGIVLKLFPQSYGVAFHVVYLAAGLGICWLTYYLMRISDVRQWLAFVLASAFIVSPGVVLFENLMLYEYPVALLLLALAAAVHRFAATQGVWWLITLYGTLLLLVLLRNLFHLVYFLAVIVALWFYFKSSRRNVALAGLLPLALIVGLYTKNWILFGSFSSSTWLGMNMDVITAHQLTPQEARDLLRRGLISPISLIDAGSPIAAYLPYIRMPAMSGIPVLDEEVTSTGATNFNNPVFLQIGHSYMRDGLSIIQHAPVAYVRSVERAWFTYFLPAGDFPFFDLNRPKIYKLDRVVNLVCFGQLRDASDRKGLRGLEASGVRLGLIKYTGAFLVTGLPALWLWSITYLWRGVRQRLICRPQALLIGFLLFNITYLTALTNFLSSFENNRYRFPLDAFFVILLGLAAERLFSAPRHEHNLISEQPRQQAGHNRQHPVQDSQNQGVRRHA